LAQLLVFRPLGERNFAHQLWSDPLFFSGILGGFSNGDLSLQDSLTGKITPVIPKQIEQVIDYRSGWAFLPPLQQLKPGYAVLIQRHDFTVQNR
jgi:hypothetical protein